MALSAGDKLGPYQILSPIGEGGMGEVWKARDTRLDRTVAIKVSKADFSERFEREARAVASLSHPNICQLFDVGPNFLVMEYLEGAPLKGPLPVEKAVEYGAQILDALDASHRKGMAHRDLKPANILVTKKGIKLLDFGLAKHMAPVKEGDATLTAALTGVDQIVGTLQYMSPEQLQAKDVDARSDLFSFGCVLYEMLSGKRAFEGQSAASLIAAILERQPAPLDIAPPLDRVIRTCLAKDPDQRFQTALDLKRNLLWAVESTPTLAPAKAPRSVPLWAVALLLAIAATGIGWAFWRGRLAAPAFRVSPTVRITRDGRSSSPALSPDGKLLAFVSWRADNNADIYVQQLNGMAPLRLTDDPAADAWPAFSADGSKIYFTSYRDPRGVYEIPVLGGDARLMIPDAEYPKPAPGGKHISYFKNGQWYVDTLPPANPVTIDARLPPVWSPDGTRLTGSKFQLFNPEGKVVEGVGGGRLAETLRQRGMLSGLSMTIRWLKDDEFLFAAPLGDAVNLWRVNLNGDIVQVTNGTSFNTVEADTAAGKLVYTANLSTGTLWSLPCDLDTGKVSGPLKRILSNEAGDAHPDVLADGSLLAYASRRNGPQGIWIKDLRTGKERLVAQPNHYGEDFAHVRLSPDGKRVAASHSNQPGRMGWKLVMLNAAGGEPKELYKDGARIRGWSPDGRFLLLWQADPPARISVLDIPARLRSDIVTRPAETFSEPKLSEDGKWLAFLNGEGKLFAAPFRGAETIPETTWVPILDRASHPAWSPDGNSIYYVPRKLDRWSGRSLYRQRLDPQTKRPVGPPTLFQSFEGMTFGGPVTNPIAVAKDQIILNMNALNSDIWATDLPDAR
jgi:serine/threonine protein kinase